MDYGWLDLFATLVANKRIFLMAHAITCFAKTKSSPLTRFAYILRGSRHNVARNIVPSFVCRLTPPPRKRGHKLALCKPLVCALSSHHVSRCDKKQGHHMVSLFFMCNNPFVDTMNYLKRKWCTLFALFAAYKFKRFCPSRVCDIEGSSR